MAIETVTLLIGEAWSLVSAAAAGPFRAEQGSGSDLIFYIGDTAPTESAEGMVRSSISYESLSTKVWVRSRKGSARARITRTVNVANQAELLLGTIALSSTTFSTSLAAGAEVATLTGRTAGDKLESISPNDGRFVISSDGTKILRGMSAVSPGKVELDIEMTHPLAPNSPRRTKIELTITLAAGGGVIALKNNLALVGSDSRGATFSADTPTPYRLNINGWVTHALQRGKYKIRIAPGGNFAVGGATSTDLVGKLPAMRALLVGVWLIMIGTNDTTDVEITKTNLRTVCSAARDDGVVVVLSNELPRDDQQALAAARRDFIETTLKAEFPNNLVVVDTFRTVQADGTVGGWKPGLTVETAGAGLHPNAKGNFLISQPFGVALEALGASYETFARLSLPTMSVRSGANPNGPVLNNFALGGSVAVNSGRVVGNNPTETSITDGSAGTSTSDCVITPSVYVNSDGFNEWAIRVSGTAGAGTPSVIASIEGAFNVPSVLDRVVAGELIWSGARLKVDPNPIGFRGLGLSCRTTGKIGTDPQYTDQWGQCFQNALVPIDGPILNDTVMASNVGVVRAGWAAATLRNLFTQVALSLAPSSAVDVTFRISQVGLYAKAA